MTDRKSLPRGTVTFLFTDIEGSTALWESDRAAMPAAIARHDALLTEAVAAHDGVLFKHVGDAAQAAFATAGQALAAAVSAQRALAAEPWALPTPLRVRMALHTGAAAPDATGDYHQVPALNHLNRLLVAAHGGQILISGAVDLLLADALPADVTLRELGEHRLRDVPEPERIWQVVVSDLPDNFPPLRTPDQHATNLPVPLTPLVGREEVISEILTLFVGNHARLVTLTGPGGTGKTRLALAVASELAPDFPDGVWFVDLAPLAAPDLVLPTIAATLGVRERGAQALQETLAAYLTDKRLLLVLDNFERLLAAATVVSDVLRSGAGISVLVTSREPLRLRGEREFAIAPLLLPDEGLKELSVLARVPAVELFVQRAQAVRPDFALTAANAAAVAAICRRLDGLPLAIELAAAQVRILPPRALLARLRRSLPMLTAGARDAPERQRTLRATITWSYDLLSLHEQSLFRQLGVFAGGWTIDAAETIAANEGKGDVLGGLSALVDKSLVRQHEDAASEPRFRMLETIREYAQDQLATADETDDVQRRHAHYFLTLTETTSEALWQVTDPALLDRMARELDNCRAAFMWCDRQGDTEWGLRLAAGLGWFWFVRGLASEGRSRLEHAAAAADVAPSVRAWALAWASPLALLQRDIAAATTMAETSVALWRKMGEESLGLAAALVPLAQADGQRGEHARAQAHLDEALAIARALHHRFLTVFVLENLAGLALLRGDLAAAKAHVAEALPLQRQIGHTWGAPYALAVLGEIARREGNLADAAAHHREALGLAYHRGDRTFVGGCLMAIASIATTCGEYERAARLFGAAEKLRESAGSWSHVSARGGDEQALSLIRDHLSEDNFATNWAAGRALSFEQVFGEALALAQTIMRSGCRGAPEPALRKSESATFQAAMPPA
jgi:predicted ATPase/class 3 adenylate cyclase